MTDAEFQAFFNELEKIGFKGIKPLTSKAWQGISGIFGGGAKRKAVSEAAKGVTKKVMPPKVIGGEHIPLGRSMTAAEIEAAKGLKGPVGKAYSERAVAQQAARMSAGQAGSAAQAEKLRALQQQARSTPVAMPGATPTMPGAPRPAPTSSMARQAPAAEVTVAGGTPAKGAYTPAREGAAVTQKATLSAAQRAQMKARAQRYAAEVQKSVRGRQGVSPLEDWTRTRMLNRIMAGRASALPIRTESGARISLASIRPEFMTPEMKRAMSKLAHLTQLKRGRAPLR